MTLFILYILSSGELQFFVEPTNLGQISTNVIAFAKEDIFNKVRYYSTSAVCACIKGT